MGLGMGGDEIRESVDEKEGVGEKESRKEK